MSENRITTGARQVQLPKQQGIKTKIKRYKTFQKLKNILRSNCKIIIQKPKKVSRTLNTNY